MIVLCHYPHQDHDERMTKYVLVISMQRNTLSVGLKMYFYFKAVSTWQ